MSKETEFAVILQALPGIGATGLSRLLEQFGSFEQVLQFTGPQPSSRYRKALRQYQADPEHHHCLARQTIENCASDGISIVTIDDQLYPPLLKEIDSPPAILYVRGDTNLLSLPQIAIVGSRQHSATGENNAGAFAKSLSASGFVITSGMALGIDAAAHCGTMPEGKTIAVLGTGIDVIYPRRHSDLYQKILSSGGAIVSEFPPGTPARAGNFPQRNRIISGLSLGVLVVEAAIQSGSLITARLALNQGREVFAIPGSIHNPLSKGCHRLIREGATLTETAQDIVSELGGMLSFVVDNSDIPPASQVQQGSMLEHSLQPVEAQVLAQLGFDYTDLDSLISRCGLSASELTGILTSLELQGCIDNRAGLYCRIS
jgi:DNA processing protein